MLIKVFGQWLNPNQILYLEYEENKMVHILMGNGITTIHGKSLDQVAEEINAQWPVINVEANTANHF